MGRPSVVVDCRVLLLLVKLLIHLSHFLGKLVNLFLFGVNAFLLKVSSVLVVLEPLLTGLHQLVTFNFQVLQVCSVCRVSRSLQQGVVTGVHSARLFSQTVCFRQILRTQQVLARRVVLCQVVPVFRVLRRNLHLQLGVFRALLVRLINCAARTAL